MRNTKHVICAHCMAIKKPINPIKPISACHNTCFQAPLLLKRIRQLFLHLVLLTQTRLSFSSTSADSRISITHLATAISFIWTTRPTNQCRRYTIRCITSIVVEEIIRHTVWSDAEIIANMHYIKELPHDFSLVYSQGCCISA